MTQDPNAYAAVESMLSSAAVPSVTRGSMKPCSGGTVKKCLQEMDDLIPTIMVLLEPYKLSTMIVHVVEDSSPSPPELCAVSKAMLPQALCVVASVERGDKGIVLYTEHDISTVHASKALEILGSMSSVENSVTWYWSPKTLNYSSLFQRGTLGAWMYTLRERHDEAHPLYESKEGCTRVVPFFYTGVDRPTCVVVNKGVPTMVPGDDLSVELMALSRLPIHRVHRTGVSSGRCFCCQYLINLHSRASGEARQGEAVQTVRLEKEFFQRMRWNPKQR